MKTSHFPENFDFSGLTSNVNFESDSFSKHDLTGSPASVKYSKPTYGHRLNDHQPPVYSKNVDELLKSQEQQQQEQNKKRKREAGKYLHQPCNELLMQKYRNHVYISKRLLDFFDSVENFFEMISERFC